MANIITPFISGKQVEWCDIKIILLGLEVIGVHGISYDEKRNMENVYGAGAEVIGRIYGSYESKAQITLLMKEAAAIVAASPNGRLQEIPEFDVIVSFVDLQYTPKIHKLKNCRFMNNGVKSSVNDPTISTDYDLIVSHIEFIEI